MDLKVHDLKVHGAGLRRAVGADVMRGGGRQGVTCSVCLCVCLCARARAFGCAYVRVYE